MTELARFARSLITKSTCTCVYIKLQLASEQSNIDIKIHVNNSLHVLSISLSTEHGKSFQEYSCKYAKTLTKVSRNAAPKKPTPILLPTTHNQWQGEVCKLTLTACFQCILITSAINEQ